MAGVYKHLVNVLCIYDLFIIVHPSIYTNVFDGPRMIRDLVCKEEEGLGQPKNMFVELH